MLRKITVNRRHRSVAFLLAFLFVSGPLRATSVVMDLKPDKILIVADSRASEIYQTGTHVHDDKCKIAVLGNQIVYSETGSEEYTPNGPSDSVPGWHGITEAQIAYENAASHSVHDVAQQWAIQVGDNFAKFYVSDPLRVRGLAIAAGPGLVGSLLAGFFAGTEDGKIVLYFAVVALDDSLLSRAPTTIPIGYNLTLVSEPKPYATNSITEELIDGKTDRAKKAAALWAKKRVSIGPANRRWRWLEFMVEQTGQYDDTVHVPVNVVRITPNGLTWIENKTCREIGGSK